MVYIQQKCRLVLDFIDSPDEEMVDEQQQEETIPLMIWNTIKIQMKTTVLLFLFIIKETLFSFIGYIDLVFISRIVNFCILFVKAHGFWEDRNHVNPQRMFLVGDMMTQRGRGRVTIRRTASWFVLALLIPFMHKSMIHTAETGVEAMKAIHENVTLSLQHLWFPNIPKTIELEESMEKMTFTDHIIPKYQFPSPLLPNDPKDYEVVSCSQGFSIRCITSKLPSWLSLGTFNPNTILCKACHRFISAGGCDQSKDDLPDFALATLGSRVLTELTSSTLEDKEDKGLLSIFKRPVINPKTTSPLVALLPWKQPGECWPMAGKQGSLGVELRQPVSVNAISIDYLGHHQAMNMASAPGDFEVWGLIKYGDRSWKYPWDSLASVVDKDVMYLGRFMYDITKSVSVQTFKLDRATPPIKAIVFRFLSNWGNHDYTCIYRVRVHGDEVA